MDKYLKRKTPSGKDSQPRNTWPSKTRRLIDMANEWELKVKFQAVSLPQYWLYVKKDYPALAERALKSLLPFATTYLCESGFSTLKVLKTKHRARLQVDNDIRLALTNLKPRIDKLCRRHQAHPSH
ncbi:hypothetical protein JOQ06_024821 [Pogonophryne albipinna]|uniref:SCAN domain-containing protein 3 n=1 Tax=Pogonophryne albipinna TaxID=1090488 RepID=A0AAD6ATM4_9TELE|nr:hypothetical protein JOQ06_024821 [Pogonophryne albipinna]